MKIKRKSDTPIIYHFPFPHFLTYQTENQTHPSKVRKLTRPKKKKKKKKKKRNIPEDLGAMKKNEAEKLKGSEV
jgi:hypothetical protein